MLCPCQSQKPYAQCCEPFIKGTARPQLPEELMRSRYTAFTEGNIDYIVATQRGQAAQALDFEATKNWALGVKWLGLEIIKAPKPGALQGTVEFIARYEEQGVVRTMHEISEFARVGGGSRWYYIGGKKPTIERNAPCSCGSGKKYKKCCAVK